MEEGRAVKLGVVSREPIRAITSSGIAMVDGVRIRDLAIHPALNWVSVGDESPIWTVTHVPSGLRLGSSIGFDSEEAALAFIKALDALPFDWSDGRKLQRDNNMRAAFDAIAMLCDAVEMVEVPA